MINLWLLAAVWREQNKENMMWSNWRLCYQNKNKINILVTLNEAYIPHLNTMLSSLLYCNRDCFFTVYLLHSSVSQENVAVTRELLGASGELILIGVDGSGLEDAPTTDRFPTEMYYRIFASKYLPKHVDRILYLDPDIIVNGSILPLYRLPMDNFYFAAASHNGKFMGMVNRARLKLEKGRPYINSGVLLINLKLLREEQRCQDVYDYIEKWKARLVLPDQDIISGLYGKRIYLLDTYVYNMSDRLYRYDSVFGKHRKVEWYRKHSIIFHYCGKNKPWKDTYSGKLGVFYDEALARMPNASGK